MKPGRRIRTFLVKLRKGALDAYHRDHKELHADHCLLVALHLAKGKSRHVNCEVEHDLELHPRSTNTSGLVLPSLNE